MTASEPDSLSRPRAVVCLSGGMDSAVCAAFAARDYEAYALHFSYGQRTERREFESAQSVADFPFRFDFRVHRDGPAIIVPSVIVPRDTRHAPQSTIAANCSKHIRSEVDQ